ncbi:MAG: hypothetical protein ACH350_04970 [Parachlamydiaceae bacterium]
MNITSPPLLPQANTSAPQPVDPRFTDWLTQLSEVTSTHLSPDEAKQWIIDLIQQNTNIASYSIEELNRFQLPRSPFQDLMANTYCRTARNPISDLMLTEYFNHQSSQVTCVMPGFKEVLKVNIRLLSIQDIFKKSSLSANMTVGGYLSQGLSKVKRGQCHVNAVINSLMKDLRRYVGQDFLWIERLQMPPFNPTQVINTRCIEEIESAISNKIEEKIRPLFIEAIGQIRLIGTAPAMEKKLALISNKPFSAPLHRILNKNGFRADQRSLIRSLINRITPFDKKTALKKLEEWTHLPISTTVVQQSYTLRSFPLAYEKWEKSTLFPPIIKELFQRLIAVMRPPDSPLPSPFFDHQLALLMEKAIINQSPHAVMRSTQRLLELYLHHCTQNDAGIAFLSEYETHFPTPPVLKGMTVFGMSALSMALAASLSMFENPKIEILTKDYFEILEFVDTQIQFNISHKEKLNDISTTCDIAIVDLHPNNAAKKWITSHPIHLWIERHLTKREKKLLLLVDATTSDLKDEDIQALITNSIDWIAQGKLSLVIAQSLTKFSQFGTDILSGGAIAVFHNRADWEPLHRKLESLMSCHTMPVDYHRFFGGLMKHASDLRQDYIQTIRENVNLLTQFFYEAVYELPIDEDCLLMRLNMNTDQHTCYISFHFDFLFATITSTQHSPPMLFPSQRKDYSDADKRQFVAKVFSDLIMPLIKEQNLPISERMSIGFQVSSLNNCGETLRLALGIENETLISQYSDFFAEIAYIMTVHPNPEQLLDPRHDFLEARRYFQYVRQVLSADFSSVIGGINIANFSHLALDLEITPEKISAFLRKKTQAIAPPGNKRKSIPMEFSGKDDFNMQGFLVDDVRRPLLIKLYDKESIDFTYQDHKIFISNVSLRAPDLREDFDCLVSPYPDSFDVSVERDVGQWSIRIAYDDDEWSETEIFLAYGNDEVPFLNLPDKQGFYFALKAEVCKIVRLNEELIVFTYEK